MVAHCSHKAGVKVRFFFPPLFFTLRSCNTDCMKKMTITKAKEKAWKQFSIFIRLRDSLKTVGNREQCMCVSCGSPYPSFGKGCLQAGHFIPGRRNGVLFHEEVVHGQCYNCNMNLKGNWVPYEKKMIEMYGRKKVDEFKKLAEVTVKYTITELQEIEAKYKLKVKDLLTHGLS